MDIKMKSFEQWKKENPDYCLDITSHDRVCNNIKLQLNKLYGHRKDFKERGYIDTDYLTPYSKMINEIITENLKIEMFKLDVIKLMLKYNLSISHEDLQGAFIIKDYQQEYAEWFLESEYKKGE